MLKQRITTALILAPLLLLAVIFLNTPWLAALLSGVILVGAWEWTRLAALKPLESVAFYAAAALAMVGVYFYPEQLGIDNWLLWSALLWWAGISVIILRYVPRPIDHQQGLVRLSKAMMGLIALVPAWWSLVQLHASPDHGVSYFLYVFFLVWAADVGAYFSGKTLGRHKLAPNVSPGKTVEGVLGGLASVAALGAGQRRLSPSFWSPPCSGAGTAGGVGRHSSAHGSGWHDCVSRGRHR